MGSLQFPLGPPLRRHVAEDDDDAIDCGSRVAPDGRQRRLHVEDLAVGHDQVQHRRRFRRAAADAADQRAGGGAFAAGDGVEEREAGQVVDRGAQDGRGRVVGMPDPAIAVDHAHAVGRMLDDRGEFGEPMEQLLALLDVAPGAHERDRDDREAHGKRHGHEPRGQRGLEARLRAALCEQAALEIDRRHQSRVEVEMEVAGRHRLSPGAAGALEGPGGGETPRDEIPDGDQACTQGGVVDRQLVEAIEPVGHLGQRPRDRRQFGALARDPPGTFGQLHVAVQPPDRRQVIDDQLGVGRPFGRPLCLDDQEHRRQPDDDQQRQPGREIGERARRARVWHADDHLDSTA